MGATKIEVAGESGKTSEVVLKTFTHQTVVTGQIVKRLTGETINVTSLETIVGTDMRTVKEREI